MNTFRLSRFGFVCFTIAHFDYATDEFQAKKQCNKYYAPALSKTYGFIVRGSLWRLSSGKKGRFVLCSFATAL
jgi:hypothetical protein